MKPPSRTRPRLKKKLGQHHLIRAESCRPLVEFLAPSGLPVLEIGPGGGLLTGALVRAGARVTAVELDLEWAAYLQRTEAEGVAIVVADALDLQYQRFAKPTLVAGNLPYNVGTSIITRVLPHHATVPKAGFLVQLEVAKRLTAEPSTSQYGSLSVFAKLFSNPEILGRVPPGAFRPPPKVDSAFVGFRLREAPLPIADLGGFESLVRQGFAHKRKTLRNSLSQGWGREPTDELLQQAGLVGAVRAEELPLEEWLRIYDHWRRIGVERGRATL